MKLGRTLHRRFVYLLLFIVSSVLVFLIRIIFFLFTGFVDSDNIFVWQAIIVDPPDTPYSEGMFLASIHSTEKYPLALIKVNLFKFLTS